MLQALLHSKLTSEERIAISANKEDSCTSSVFGLLQYLPDDLLLDILKQSCGNLASFPNDIGAIQHMLFWEKFSSYHISNINQKYVEPDVIIEAENYSIVIEAKKYDGFSQQYEKQWKQEILVVEDWHEQERNEKGIIFIAIGGTDYSRDKEALVGDKSYPIHVASWIGLSDAIIKVLDKMPKPESPTENHNLIRLLKDAVKALEHFGHFRTIWLNSLPNIKISPLDKSLYYRWKSYDNKVLEGFYRNHNKIKITEINQLWKPTL